eukprot:gb/GECH01012928.1/.p1 GENE.gb/GECH01012928.1/~~gb/GECH01012928.1/.p1  ORF type:complete len:373 (+),score=98.42 gb/GECH01012928.1/:1-1119(+)
MKALQTLLCVCIILGIYASTISAAPSSQVNNRFFFNQEYTLENIQKIGLNELIGPEGLAFDSQGFGYTGCADGIIRRINFEDNSITEYARSANLTQEQRSQCGSPLLESVCGRPLGLEFDSQDNLYVADGYKGLLRFPRNGDGTPEVLATSPGPNEPQFKLLNDVALSPDEQTIYFTDTSQVYTRAQFVRITLDSNPDGRLFKYDLNTGDITLLIDDLEFANGIAFSRFENFLAIVETSARRVRRYFPSTGHVNILAQNLIGYPDNIHEDNGLFYLGMFSKTSELVEDLQDLDSFRNVVYDYIPDQVVLGQVPRTGLVAAYDGFGFLRKTFIDEGGDDIAFVAEGYPRNGKLYLCSVINPFLGAYDIPDQPN